mmetsp:Transcript_8782/g.14425  ORF Transcript_8782/g.14425 Transcript_8782/m.14425 type:complete len:304 (+) Transcript_8782:1577-2488(+)
MEVSSRLPSLANAACNCSTEIDDVGTCGESGPSTGNSAPTLALAPAGTRRGELDWAGRALVLLLVLGCCFRLAAVAAREGMSVVVVVDGGEEAARVALGPGPGPEPVAEAEAEAELERELDLGTKGRSRWLTTVQAPCALLQLPLAPSAASSEEPPTAPPASASRGCFFRIRMLATAATAEPLAVTEAAVAEAEAAEAVAAVAGADAGADAVGGGTAAVTDTTEASLLFTDQFSVSVGAGAVGLQGGEGAGGSKLGLSQSSAASPPLGADPLTACPIPIPFGTGTGTSAAMGLGPPSSETTLS